MASAASPFLNRTCPLGQVDPFEGLGHILDGPMVQTLKQLEGFEVSAESPRQWTFVIDERRFLFREVFIFHLGH
jgi:hypothetical protein